MHLVSYSFLEVVSFFLFSCGGSVASLLLAIDYRPFYACNGFRNSIDLTSMFGYFWLQNSLSWFPFVLIAWFIFTAVSCLLVLFTACLCYDCPIMIFLGFDNLLCTLICNSSKVLILAWLSVFNNLYSCRVNICNNSLDREALPLFRFSSMLASLKVYLLLLIFAVFCLMPAAQVFRFAA